MLVRSNMKATVATWNRTEEWRVLVVALWRADLHLHLGRWLVSTLDLSALGIRLVVSLCFILCVMFCTIQTCASYARRSGFLLCPTDVIASVVAGKNDPMLGRFQPSKHSFHKKACQH